MTGLIDVGSGPPLVLVPGVQGRWEWMGPAVDHLSRYCRVLTVSLAGEPGSGRTYDPARGFDNYLDQIDELLERAALRDAAICGVSFGGLIALYWASRRQEATRSLVLASAPAPEWRPDCRIEWYLKAPRLLSPLFAAQSPFRVGPEIWQAFDRIGPRLSFAVRHLATVARHPFSPPRMAARAKLMAAGTVDFVAACQQVTAPTLIVTGEPGLDRVVPVEGTRRYADRIRGATAQTIAGTGHLGLVTKPDRFAETVGQFVIAPDRQAAPLRRPA